MIKQRTTHTETEHRRSLSVVEVNHGHALSCGVEVGSLESFYSFENRTLGLVVGRRECLRVTQDQWRFHAAFELPGARLSLEERGELSGPHGVRRLTVKSDSESSIMDCVLRFVIPRQDVQQAFIGDREIVHRSSNRYHQYENAPVRLQMRSGKTLAFTCPDSRHPSGMTPIVYLRDERQAWILHFRLLATKPDFFTFKGCHRLYNRSFPAALQYIALRSSYLRDRLLYVRERVSQRIPVQVNGAVRLPQGESAGLTVRWVWSE